MQTSKTVLDPKAFSGALIQAVREAVLRTNPLLSPLVQDVEVQITQLEPKGVKLRIVVNVQAIPRDVPTKEEAPG